MSTFPLASNDTLGTLSTQPSASVTYGTSYSTDMKADPSAYTRSTIQSAPPSQSTGTRLEVLEDKLQRLVDDHVNLDVSLFENEYKLDGIDSLKRTEQEIAPLPDGCKLVTRLVLLDGSRYTGQLNKDGKPSGRGFLIYPPANTNARLFYVGKFENDMPHGEGILQWVNGEKFEGIMDRGRTELEVKEGSTCHCGNCTIL